jgi:hypothetical protein
MPDLIGYPFDSLDSQLVSGGTGLKLLEANPAAGERRDDENPSEFAILVRFRTLLESEK